MADYSNYTLHDLVKEYCNVQDELSGISLNTFTYNPKIKELTLSLTLIEDEIKKKKEKIDKEN